MLPIQKIEAMKRIKEEFAEINENPNPNIGLAIGIPEKDNIFKWRVTLTGPQDSSYKRGVFILFVEFPDNYPESAPEIYFTTPIYHLNINPYNNIGVKLGHVSLDFLNNWKPEYTIRETFIYIYGLFYKPNPDNAYGLERANEFRFNKQLYEDKIKYFTRKYAYPGASNICKKYDNWDFTYD